MKQQRAWWQGPTQPGHNSFWIVASADDPNGPTALVSVQTIELDITTWFKKKMEMCSSVKEKGGGGGEASPKKKFWKTLPGQMQNWKSNYYFLTCSRMLCWRDALSITDCYWRISSCTIWFLWCITTQFVLELQLMDSHSDETCLVSNALKTINQPVSVCMNFLCCLLVGRA